MLLLKVKPNGKTNLIVFILLKCPPQRFSKDRSLVVQCYCRKKPKLIKLTLILDTNCIRFKMFFVEISKNRLSNVQCYITEKKLLHKLNYSIFVLLDSSISYKLSVFPRDPSIISPCICSNKIQYVASVGSRLQHQKTAKVLIRFDVSSKGPSSGISVTGISSQRRAFARNVESYCIQATDY